VEGALFEMLPKCGSHVACGHLDSACSHCLLASSCNLSVFCPRSYLVARDESFGNKVNFLLG
jgi:hypothetical protein